MMFLRMLDRAGASAKTRAAFAAEPLFALRAPADPDAAGTRYLSIMAGRAPDGLRLYEAIVSAGTALPPRPVIDAADVPKATAAARSFRDWFRARYSVPAGPPAGPPSWVVERMEYAFAVSAAGADGEIVLSAAEYPGGTLDWYAFDVERGRTLGPENSDPRPTDVVRTMIPAPLRYPGMASDRWWQLEDARVNFGRIEGDADELPRLMLVNFALQYCNDWFVLPVEAAPGAVYRLRSLVVTDAFGQRTLVPHYTAAGGADDWRMFAMSPDDAGLFVPPVLAGGLSGDPIEEVLMLRDELANLVWGIERLAPSVAGGAFDREAAQRQAAGDEPAPPPATPAADRSLRYELASTVKPNWIPFRPVRIDPQQPAVKLRRAAAIVDDGGVPGLSRPLGRILEPDRPDLSLFEEEVPRSGARIVRQYQYARWSDGGTVLWLGRRKSPGSGEGSSGLRFDHVVDA